MLALVVIVGVYLFAKGVEAAVFWFFTPAPEAKVPAANEAPAFSADTASASA